ncbi:hypothetical protein H2200_004601 [Cladophialophora chaetospira]|uniref:AB hydrolase-1 domain-containing protein n=1 Tax=Cladophialophora chaetospira TaxID=386627 RepID=A0AA39CJM1_9EURO|nr:hypothetical protein H2200_004601 [Cladophialophora chaetospira]
MPAPMLRPTSKFRPFSITLANGAEVTGIASIPSAFASSSRTTGRPLLVLVHGGKCTPHHFDLSDSHTYSSLSDLGDLAIPVVAIHRPGYGGSTSFLPIADENDEPGEIRYHQETARWLHKFIFPALWERFGVLNQCAGMVAVGHSMGGIQVVVAAELYARDRSAPRKYPLMGIVMSGMGSRFVARPELSEGFPEGEALPEEIFFKAGVMGKLMLGDRSLRLCDSGIYGMVDEMDVGMPREELLSLLAWWPVHWKRCAGEVTVPVLYGLGEYDWLWETNEEHVAEFRAAFVKCENWEGGLVKGAPHCIEWSRAGREWMRKVGVWSADVVDVAARKTTVARASNNP